MLTTSIFSKAQSKADAMLAKVHEAEKRNDPAAETLRREWEHLHLQATNSRKPWHFTSKQLRAAISFDDEIKQAAFEQQVLEWERNQQMAEVEKLLAEELAG